MQTYIKNVPGPNKITNRVLNDECDLAVMPQALMYNAP